MRCTSCLCPKCARSTAGERDLQDFPFRCTNCGALLKSPAPLSPSPAGEQPTDTDKKPRATLLTVGRWQANKEVAQGAISQLLAPTPAMEPPSGTTEQRSRILRPESLREISRAAARQKALRKAQLRGSLHALKALSVMGVFLVGTLLLGAMALQANTLWHRQAQANTTGEFAGTVAESASPDANPIKPPIPDAR